MNKREIYKERLEEHETAFDVTPSPNYVGWYMHESSYLDKDAQKDLREDVKSRIKGGHNVVYDTNGKATWYINEDGEKVLRSYYTDVMKISPERGIVKLWEGYSVTTMGHINKFLDMNGISSLSKQEWIMMETE